MGAVLNVYVSYLSLQEVFKIRHIFNGSRARLFEENEGDWYGVHCYSYHEEDGPFFQRLYDEFGDHVHEI